MGYIHSITKRTKLIYIGLISPILLGGLSIAIIIAAMVMHWSVVHDIRFIDDKALKSVKDNSSLAKDLQTHHQTLLRIIVWSSNGVSQNKLEELSKKLLLLRSQIAIRLLDWSQSASTSEKKKKIEKLVSSYLNATLDAQDIGIIDGAMGAMLMNSADEIFQELSGLILSNNIKKTLDAKNFAKEKVRHAERVSLIFLFGAILFTIIALIVSALFMKSLSDNLRSMYRLMLEISNGNVDSEIPGCDSKNELGAISRALKIFSDSMRELSNAKERMKMMALSDPLTKLPNRRGLQDKLLPFMKDSFIKSDTQISLFHIDLDGFKLVNDQYGHAAGDHVLIETAAQLSKVSSPDDIIARVGGDEFVYILVGEQSKAELEYTGYKIVQRISQPIVYEQKKLNIGASIGISSYTPESMMTYDRLLANADTALYEVKRNGKSAALFYDEAVRSRVEKYASVDDKLLYTRDREETEKVIDEKDLISAIDHKEFSPLFEPQINMETGCITGFKVLSRWYHPKKGELVPAAYINLANKYNLTSEIDNQVMNKALASLKRWDGLDYKIPSLSILIGDVYFKQDKFVENVLELTQSHGLSSDRLTLYIHNNILENYKTDNSLLIKIDTLRERGFKVEFDTIVTSSDYISCLHGVTIDRVNIDCNFMNALHTHAELQKVTKVMIDSLKVLDLTIVAKGVENKRQKAILKILGCDIIQGQIVGAPMSTEEIDKWIEEHPDSNFDTLADDLLISQKSA